MAAVFLSGGRLKPAGQFGSYTARLQNISAGGLCLEIPLSQANRGVVAQLNGNPVEVSIPRIVGRQRIRAVIVWVWREVDKIRIGLRMPLDAQVRALIRSYLRGPSASRYKIGLYDIQWKRRYLQSLAGFLRDCIVQALPFRLPAAIVRLLYGVTPSYAFYVHPRRKDDIFISFPLLNLLRRLPSKKFLSIAAALPPFVIGTVKRGDCAGVIVATLQMPSELMQDVKGAIKKAGTTVRFVGRICPNGGVLGLGAWWPMVTRRGFALQKAGIRNRVTVTNGHCGTLVSIYLMVQRIAQMSDIPIGKLHVGVIGVGKMGRNVALVLNGLVGKLSLFDVHRRRLDAVLSKLQTGRWISALDGICVSPSDEQGLRAALSVPHLLVCTTSNIRKLFVSSSLPARFVVIDDSRPEAFFRSAPESGRVVIEGGLMKLPGAIVNYDFGFGIDDNVFGCLAESHALAQDGGQRLRETIGDVDLGNFWQMVRFYECQGIAAGEFKSGSRIIKPQWITDIVRHKYDSCVEEFAVEEASKGSMPPDQSATRP